MGRRDERGSTRIRNGGVQEADGSRSTTTLRSNVVGSLSASKENATAVRRPAEPRGPRVPGDRHGVQDVVPAGSTPTSPCGSFRGRP